MPCSQKPQLAFAKMQGLIPTIVQDLQTKEIFMLGFQNQKAFDLTCQTGLVHFWSRSRQTIWQKGATSGNYLKVQTIWTDCDKDTILIQVTAGKNLQACHTGKRSCFFTKIFPQTKTKQAANPLTEKLLAKQLFQIFQFLQKTPKFPQSQTARLLKTQPPPFFQKRAQEEFQELRDCVAGTHRHSADFQADFLLESSQVFYWLALRAIRAGNTFAKFWSCQKIQELQDLHQKTKIKLTTMLQKEIQQCREKGYLL